MYAQLGITLTAEAQAAMEAWLERKQVRHGGHRARLIDFDLDEEGVMADPVFAEYCERFGVACPGGHS